MKISNVISVTLGLCMIAGFIFYSCTKKESAYCHDGEMTDDDKSWFGGFGGGVYQKNTGGYDTGVVYKDDWYGTLLSKEGHCHNSHMTTGGKIEAQSQSVSSSLYISHGSGPQLFVGHGLNLSQISVSDSNKYVGWTISNAYLNGSDYILTWDSLKITNNVPFKVIFSKAQGIKQMFFKGNVVLTKL